MPKLKKKTIALYILILVILYLIVAVLPSVSSALTPTETAEYGRLTVKDDVTAYIVRDETCYKAPCSGIASWKLKEGALIRKDTPVISIKEQKKSGSEMKDSGLSGDDERIASALGESLVSDETGRALRRGKYSNYADGYENYYTPSKMNGITQREAEKHSDDPVNLKKRKVEKGAPIYRICDNKAWYIMCWIDEGSIGKYEKGKELSVRFSEGTVSAVVSRISQEGKKWKLILKSTSYMKNYEKIRRADVSVITSNSKGLIVSNRSITTKNGKVGVYVRSTTGDYVFTRVQVLGTNGEKTLISEDSYYDKEGNSVSTVKNYDEVLKRP